MIPIPYQAASRPQLLLPLFCSRVPAGFPSPADDYLEAKLDLVALLCDLHGTSARLQHELGASPCSDTLDRSITPKLGMIVLAI